MHCHKNMVVYKVLLQVVATNDLQGKETSVYAKIFGARQRCVEIIYDVDGHPVGVGRHNGV